MRLNPPKKSTWWLAVLLGAAGIAAHVVSIPVLSSIAFWLVALGWLLLLLGAWLPGL